MLLPRHLHGGGQTLRLNATTDLARLLVGAGIADQEVQIRQPGIAGHLAWKSLHRMAEYAYKEGANSPLRRVRWSPRPEIEYGVTGKPENTGSDDPEGSE